MKCLFFIFAFADCQQTPCILKKEPTFCSESTMNQPYLCKTGSLTSCWNSIDIVKKRNEIPCWNNITSCSPIYCDSVLQCNIATIYGANIAEAGPLIVTGGTVQEVQGAAQVRTLDTHCQWSQPRQHTGNTAPVGACLCLPLHSLDNCTPLPWHSQQIVCIRPSSYPQQ